MQFLRHVLQLFWSAAALFGNPKQASAIPASPTPNFFSAPRRVTDWARPFVSSSNLLFILFLLFWLVIRTPPADPLSSIGFKPEKLLRLGDRTGERAGRAGKVCICPRDCRRRLQTKRRVRPA